MTHRLYSAASGDLPLKPVHKVHDLRANEYWRWVVIMPLYASAYPSVFVFFFSFFFFLFLFENTPGVHDLISNGWQKYRFSNVSSVPTDIKNFLGVCNKSGQNYEGLVVSLPRCIKAIWHGLLLVLYTSMHEEIKSL